MLFIDFVQSNKSWSWQHKPTAKSRQQFLSVITNGLRKHSAINTLLLVTSRGRCGGWNRSSGGMLGKVSLYFQHSFLLRSWTK